MWSVIWQGRPTSPASRRRRRVTPRAVAIVPPSHVRPRTVQRHPQPAPNRLPHAGGSAPARAGDPGRVAGHGPLRPAPGAPGRRPQLHPPRRPALHQRPHPLRPHPQQDPQGHRGQGTVDGRVPLALRAGLGHPRPAHRAPGRARAGRAPRRHDRGRDPRGLPRLRPPLRRHPADRVPPPGRPGRLGPPLPDPRPVLRGRGGQSPGRVRPRRLPLPRQEAGLLVPARRHRPGRGRDRVRRPHLAVDLRELPAGGAGRRRRRSEPDRSAPGGHVPGAAHLDHHPVDPAGQPGHRAPPRPRLCRGALAARPRQLLPGGPRPGRQLLPGHGRARRAGHCHRHRQGPAARPRGRPLPPPADRHAARRHRLPGLVRRLRHPRAGHRPGPHRAGPRRRRLPDRRGPRPRPLRPGR